MAQTLASGVVIPAPGDRISAAGVQEMRTLGASVDTGLALTQAQTAQTDLQARARDADLADQIAGMEGMTYVGAWESGRTYRINDVVTHGGDSWARLTAGSAGEPGASPTDWGLVARKGDGGGVGELTETGTPGLWEGVDVGIADRLAALEYKSGWRDITSRVEVPVTGQILVMRDGDTIWVDFRDFAPSAEAVSSIVLSNVLPDGFKPPREMSLPLGPRVFDAANEIKGSVRVYLAGNLAFYRVAAGAVARGIGSFPAGQVPPTTLPGTPA